MSILGVIGALGSAIGGLGGLFQGLGSVGSSALNYAATNEGLKKQFGYNKELQKQSYGYNKNLQKQSYSYNKGLQSQSYNLSKSLQQFQNDYTTMMSNSAHQREVADLRAAGLNPLLSANNGASTPSAGGAIVGSGSVGAGSVGAGSVGLPSYSPGSDALDAFLNIKHLKNETKNTDSSVDLQKSQSWNQRQQAGYYGELERNEAERFENIKAERDVMLRNIQNQTLVSAAQADYYRKLGDSSIIQALSNERYNSALTVGQLQSNQLRKKDIDFYGSGYGKFIYGLGQTTGAIGNILGGHLGLSGSSVTSHLK